MRLEEYVQFYLSLGEHDVTYSIEEMSEISIENFNTIFDFKVTKVLKVTEMDSDIPLFSKLLRKVILYALETEQGFKMIFRDSKPEKSSSYKVTHELIDEE